MTIKDDSAGKDHKAAPAAGNNPGAPIPRDLEHWPTPRLLSTAARLAKKAWTENLRSAELTHAGFITLDVLAFTGPLTPARLAQIAHVQAQTTGRILGTLERHGYVTRQRNPQYRRVSLINITEEGKKALARALESEQQILTAAHLDTDTLRHDLKILVRELTNPQRPPPEHHPPATSPAERKEKTPHRPRNLKTGPAKAIRRTILSPTVTRMMWTSRPLTPEAMNAPCQAGQ